jgi:flagellar biosynthesis/type III secretory pathway protein FliH
MNLEEAIEVLKEWIRIDRMTREGEEHSDYDDFCEEKCIAIDTVLKALDERYNKGYNKGYQDGFHSARYDKYMNEIYGEGESAVKYLKIREEGYLRGFADGYERAKDVRR